MLPDPALTLSLPSIHDGTIIDCRIYYPASLLSSPRAPPWRRHAAVFAHPYAPMGGCYDDPLLDVAASQLLRSGYLVGTFNFRGAGHSAGRTSWTARPERDDYTSFIGFVVHFIHHLDPFGCNAAVWPDSQRIPCVPESSSELNTTATLPPLPNVPPVLIMGGYSYGAMVTTQLPPLRKLLEPFDSPESESDAAQIRLRAESLAEQQNIILGDARLAMLQHRNPSSPAKRMVRVGGDEGGSSPRKSHDSFGRRSFSLDAEEKLRKSMHELLAKRKSGRHRRRSWHAADSDQPDQPKCPTTSYNNRKLPPVDGLIIPLPAYLLISPLQGLVTHLATMKLIPSALTRPKGPVVEAAEAKLVQNPTLAIYGDQDVFVPATKLRSWAERLHGQEGSRFSSREIEEAGHFWAEEGVLNRMLDLVAEFAGELVMLKS